MFVLSSSLEICLTVSFVSSSHVLMSSALIPLLSPAFPFPESVNGSLQCFCRELWNFFHLFYTGTLISFVIVRLVLVDFQLCFFRLVIWHHSLLLNSPKILAIPLLDVMISPFSFLTFGMSVLFLADVMFEIILDAFEFFQYVLDLFLSSGSFRL